MDNEGSEKQGGRAVDWNKLKREYVKGGISYRQLSEKYDVPLGTLKRKAGNEGWAKLRDQAAAKASMKMVDSISEQNAATTKRIYATADKLLDKLTEALEMVTPEDILMDKKGFRSLTGALNDIKAIKDMKSGMDIREQEARIARLQKDAQQEDNAVSEVVVTIGGGDASWQS